MLRRCAPRNDERAKTFSRRDSPEFWDRYSAPRKTEGAGNAGCWPHPRALRAQECAFHARKQRQVPPKHRHSLHDGLRLIRVLLGAPGCLATVACLSLAGLIPASGNRDRTISPSAPARSSRAPERPSPPAARPVTIGHNAPLVGRDRRNIGMISLPKKRIIFIAGLERGEHIDDPCEISFCAQAVRWVERSETHRFCARQRWVSLALNPSHAE